MIRGAIVGNLAWSGIRARPQLWLLLALGVALAAFLPVVAAGLRTETSVAAVRASLEALPPGERTALAVTSRDLRSAELTLVDASVRNGFRSAGLVSVEHSLTFRPLSLGGTDTTVGAVTNLDSELTLLSGRAPRRCRPAACEVLAVQPPNGLRTVDLAALTRSARTLGLVAVGTARLEDQRPVGVRLVSADVPLLLGADPAAMAELSALGLFGRNTAWFGGLDGATVAAAGVGSTTRTLADVADLLNSSSGPFSVSWPVEAVAAAGARADASARRFTLLGAGAGLLQLGFCLVVAAGMRRRSQQTARLLTRRGATAAQVLLVAASQPLLPVAGGLLLGTLAAVVVVALRARALLEQPWSAGWQAVLTTAPTLVLLGLAAIVLTCGVARWPARAGRSLQLVLDALLLMLLATTVLLLVSVARDAAGTSAPSVVVSVALVAGLIAARAWDPVAALVGRRRAGARVRPVRAVALVGGRRRPLLIKVTAGFLAAACCSAVFASAYRESLRQSVVDQAAEQVPLDVRLSPSTSVAVPLDVLNAGELRAAVPQVGIYPVVSSSVRAFSGSSRATALPLTGIDPQLLPLVHEFAATTGAEFSATELAGRLTVPAKEDVTAPVLPAGTTSISVAVTGSTTDVTVALWLSTPEGREEHVELSRSGAALVGRLTPGPPRSVRAVEIAESATHQMHRLHGVGEGGSDRELAAGTLRLGAVTADSRPMAWSWAFWGSDQAEPVAAAESLTTRYAVGDERVVLISGFVPRAAVAPLPVAVDPDTAARAGPSGTFGITANGQTVPARIVAVLPRMPTLPSAFVLADRSAVTTLLQRTAPGTASVSQVWIAAPPASVAAVRNVLDSSSASRATLTYRSDVLEAIRADPVAIRSLTLLAFAGAAALLLALTGLATAIRADRTESAGDQLALELDGWGPRQVQQVLLVRWLSVLLVAVPLGVAAGVILTAIGVQTLGAGPGGTEVVPPLRLVLVTPTTVSLVVGVLLGGLFVCVLATAAARQSSTGRSDLDSW